MAAKCYLTFRDLKAFGPLGSSPEKVRDAFKRIFHKEPRSIVMNDESYFKAEQFPITLIQNRFAYKYLRSKIKYVEEPSDEGSTQVVLARGIVTNTSQTDVTVDVTLNGSWIQKTTVSTTLPGSITYTPDFVLQFQPSSGSLIRIVTSAAEVKTESVMQNAMAQVKVFVKSNTEIPVTLLGTNRLQTVKFRSKINACGEIVAIFPEKVQGEYVHFVDVNQFLEETSVPLTGTIVRNLVGDIKAVIGKTVLH